MRKLYITDSSLQVLTNLTKLKLKYNANINNSSISVLTNLTDLQLDGADEVDYWVLKSVLTKLKNYPYDPYSPIDL